MPTVLRFAALRVAIYPNDHRPAHVHVIGGGREAVFLLRCPGGPVELRGNHGFAARDLTAIVLELEKALPLLCAAWRDLHGDH